MVDSLPTESGTRFAPDAINRWNRNIGAINRLELVPSETSQLTHESPRRLAATGSTLPVSDTHAKLDNLRGMR